MTIDEFVAEEHSRLERFKQEWLNGQKTRPEHYPVEMQAGDWGDQYLAFESA